MIDFEQALTSTYLANPCQVLPNALWKTLALAPNCQTEFNIEHDAITHLSMWDKYTTFVYWHIERRQTQLPWQHFKAQNLVILHQDFISALPTGHFSTSQPYFRQSAQPSSSPAAQFPPNYGTADVNVNTETALVADMLEKCYAGLLLSPEHVQNWTHHPTFDPKLWLWVIDKKQDIPVGLGIAELDASIGKASLEWIQVLPAYRQKGLGKGIVLTLLKRLQSRARFITVSGKLNNPTNPKSLYQSCGFAGNDVWWMVRPQI